MKFNLLINMLRLWPVILTLGFSVSTNAAVVTPLQCPPNSTLYQIYLDTTNSAPTDTNFVKRLSTASAPYAFGGTQAPTATVTLTRNVGTTVKTTAYAGRNGVYFENNGGYPKGTVLATVALSVDMPVVAASIIFRDVDGVVGGGQNYIDTINGAGWQFSGSGTYFSPSSGSLVTARGNIDCSGGVQCDVYGNFSGYGKSFSANWVADQSAGSSSYQAVQVNDIQFCVADPQINVVKDAQPNSTKAFDFTMTGQSAFSLTDNGTTANTKQFVPLTKGTAYTITETAFSAADAATWTLSSITCLDPTLATKGSTNLGARQATVTIQAGEIVTCTFVNTGKVDLSVTKTNNGGTADLANDTLTAGTATAPVTTNYTVVFKNNSTLDASGATISDTPSSGLKNCVVSSCTTTGGATACPANGTAILSGGASQQLTAFPAGASMTIGVTCEVGAP